MFIVQKTVHNFFIAAFPARIERHIEYEKELLKYVTVSTRGLTIRYGYARLNHVSHKNKNVRNLVKVTLPSRGRTCTHGGIRMTLCLALKAVRAVSLAVGRQALQ